MNEEEPQAGWTAAIVRCVLCNTTWTAMFHISCERLECPECGNMVEVGIVEEDTDN